MRWSYKTVHYALKKEGLLGSTFLDQSEMEQSLNEYGMAGWELVAMVDTVDGLIGVFKQPLAMSGSSYPASPEPWPVEEPIEAAEREAVSLAGVEREYLEDDESIAGQEDEATATQPLTVRDVGKIRIE